MSSLQRFSTSAAHPGAAARRAGEAALPRRSRAARPRGVVADARRSRRRSPTVKHRRRASAGPAACPSRRCARRPSGRSDAGAHSARRRRACRRASRWSRTSDITDQVAARVARAAARRRDPASTRPRRRRAWRRPIRQRLGVAVDADHARRRAGSGGERDREAAGSGADVGDPGAVGARPGGRPARRAARGQSRSAAWSRATIDVVEAGQPRQPAGGGSRTGLRSRRSLGEPTS